MSLNGKVPHASHGRVCGLPLDKPPAHRAPLGRMNSSARPNPARWAELRDHGPLARTTSAREFNLNTSPDPEHETILDPLAGKNA